MEQAPETITFEQALGVLRRRLALIVLCVVVVGGAAYAYSKSQTKQYTATAALSFSSSPLDQQIAGLPATGVSSLAAQQANDLELVKLGDMAGKSAQQLGHGLTEEQVVKAIAVVGRGESGVVDVSATTSSPLLSAQIANAYSHQFVVEQQEANRKYFHSALALVHRQLAKLTAKQRVGPDGLELQDRAQTLGLLSEIDYGNVQVAQQASAPTSASGPKTSRNVSIGLVLGLLLGLLLAFVLERLDRRIRRPEDLEAIYRLPVLAAVPQSGALARTAQQPPSAGEPLPAAQARAFELIRAQLRFQGGERELRTILVASPADGEGKTTIARQIAVTEARLGSRVLLIDVDLRHPSPMGRSGGPGLADVLRGEVTLDDATHSSAQGLHDDATLDTLAGGTALPANPAKLLESPAMMGVLERARRGYDLVVIDTPSLTEVPDALALLSKVDGVLIVGRVGRSRRESAEQLHHILAGSECPLLGLIANSSRSVAGGAYEPSGAHANTPAAASVNGASPSQERVSVVKL